MRAARKLTPADISVVEIVRDTQVAVTLAEVANDLDQMASNADMLPGASLLAERMRRQRDALLGLLRKDPAHT